MFDLFLENVAINELHGYFEVLDYRYFEDQWKDCVKEMQQTFDCTYDTRFMLIDTESKQCPCPFTMPDRKTAEAVLACQKDKDKVEIAMVLVER